MAKAKKNPRNTFITEAEHRKRLHGASEILVHRCMMILFRVLRDKEGYDVKDLRRIYNEVEALSESVKEGRVSWRDLEVAASEEDDVTFGKCYHHRWLKG